MSITISENKINEHIKSTEKEYSRYAGENVTVWTPDEFESIYVYGSELACLRLYKKFGMGNVEFSTNLNTWVFSIQEHDRMKARVAGQALREANMI